ncbi:MAG: TolC family protein, partial [Longimicrobiales bacterium]
MTRRPLFVLVLCGVLVPTAAAVPAHAQEPSGVDTLRLEILHSDALRRDARAVQLELLAGQSALRLRSLDAERLPALSVVAQSQYQSDVATLPVDLPGVTPPAPPRDTYDAHLAARQPLYDPVLRARREVERAELAESQAQVRTSLYQIRTNVDDAYFTALLLQAQAAEVSAAITELEAQLHLAAERVQAGTALPSEAALLEAALLRRRQALDELAAGGAAARQVLGQLTGRTIGDADALVVPDLSDDVA